MKRPLNKIGLKGLHGHSISAICDRRHGLSRSDPNYNGYSKEAYEEVRSLLDREGTSYLSVTERQKRLDPSAQMVTAILMDERETDLEVERKSAEAPFYESVMENPMSFNDLGGDCKPDYPELAPFAGGVVRFDERAVQKWLKRRPFHGRAKLGLGTEVTSRE